MPTALGARPSNMPLPTGTSIRKRASDVGSTVWPGTDNFLLVDADGSTGVYRKPERFWLKAGASLIAYPIAAGWVTYVYAMRLVVNGNYGNDLNGVGTFTKYNSTEGAGHADPWTGSSIEGLWYCEKDTDYMVYLLSRYGGGNTYYYRSNGHMNMWAYTIGEGVY